MKSKLKILVNESFLSNDGVSFLKGKIYKVKDEGLTVLSVEGEEKKVAGLFIHKYGFKGYPEYGKYDVIGEFQVN